MWITTVRMLKGFVIGTILGLVLGVAMGIIRYVRAALNSTLTALYTVPKIALLPVYLLIFGFDEAPRVYMIATVVFFFVWIYTMAPIMAVPMGYREAAASFNAVALADVPPRAVAGRAAHRSSWVCGWPPGWPC